MKNSILQSNRSHYFRFFVVMTVISFSFFNLNASILAYQTGDEKKIMKFLYENINYPTDTIEQGIEGLVTVSFQVKNGELSDLKLIKKQHPVLNDEVLRLFKSMPTSTFDMDDKEQVTEYSVFFRLNIQQDSKEYHTHSVPDNTFILTYLEDAHNTPMSRTSPLVIT